MTDQDHQLPLLPLRDVVVYPHMVLPLFVGRERSMEALEHAMLDNKQVLLVAQRNASDDQPGVDDLYQVGTVSNILQLLKLQCWPLTMMNSLPWRRSDKSRPTPFPSATPPRWSRRR